MHGQHWPTPTTPTFGLGHDHEYDEHDHHAKKSVLAKVKDKAKKWRQILTRKKHGHDDDDDAANWTPPWGVSLEEDDDDEEDPEYHGAPMYESEMAPEMYKKAEPVYGSDWIKESEMKGANDTRREPKLRHLNSIKRTSMAVPPPVSDKRMSTVRGSTNNSPSSKTVSEMVREILVPAYNIATEATYSVAWKIQAADVGPRCEAGARQVWDKGMAVREYLVRKLQPGEDDRALCEVINEAVSPRNGRAAPGKGGFAETVRLAVMSSLQGREESSQGSPIPVSTNPHTTAAEEEEEAETGGRKLQACAK